MNDRISIIFLKFPKFSQIYFMNIYLNQKEEIKNTLIKSIIQKRVPSQHHYNLNNYYLQIYVISYPLRNSGLIRKKL